MEKKKLISIVLPVYNGEAFLEEAIKSILNQTYQNLELIVVNDCSTDNTAQIIEEYERLDNRIRIINNEKNMKLPLSLNAGFEIANGEYLTWTSDDNIYMPTAVEEMYSFLEENMEYGFVYTDMEFINEMGEVYGRNESKPQDLFLYNCIGACFLYKSDVKKVIGGYCPEKFLVEDYDYWLRVSKQYKIGHIEKCLYKYRNHVNSLSVTKARSVGEQVLKLKHENLKYIVSNISEEEKEILMFEFRVYGYMENKEFYETAFQSDYIDKRKLMLKEFTYERDKKTILFGSGSIGRNALEYLGEQNVYAFVDNDEEKIGTFINGRKVISAKELKKIYKKYNLVISTDIRKAYYIAKQLEEMQIEKYTVYSLIVGGI